MINFLKKTYRYIRYSIFPFFYRMILIPFHYTNWKKYHNHLFLVYTMGKVGSSTIYESLKTTLPTSKIYHTHFLSNHWLQNILPNLDSNYRSNIITGNKIRKILFQNPQKKIVIITLVREPLSREISNIFQNKAAIFNNKQDIETSLQYLNNSKNYDYTLDWFDTEFKNFTNIDIYDFSFNHQKGFTIIEQHNFKVLCIQLEQLNHCYTKAFQELIDLEIPTLQKANITNEKSTDKILNQQLRTTFSTSSMLLDKLYNSKYVLHFYTKNQINSFHKKWLK
jgi:hypothetical protein